jgi:hypothetical protein
VLQYQMPSVIDNVGVVLLEAEDNLYPGAQLAIASTSLVVLRAVDGAGLSSECRFRVEVTFVKEAVQCVRNLSYADILSTTEGISTLGALTASQTQDWLLAPPALPVLLKQLSAAVTVLADIAPLVVNELTVAGPNTSSRPAV